MKEKYLAWLMGWFYLHLDDLKDEEDRIKIFTLDNPGWGLIINLENTTLKDKSFQKIKVERDEKNWFVCQVRNGIFECAGGPHNLPEILKVFKNWAFNNISETFQDADVFNDLDFLNPQLVFLLNWFYQQCDEDWEHCFGIGIYTTKRPGWKMHISIAETELEDKSFDRMEIHRNEKDWIECYVENKAFFGEGGPLNLLEVLGVFQKWAES